VLSRGKLTPATVSYYTDTVARGIDDYYTGRGESPGVWLGPGAAAEGLDGEVTSEELGRLFAEGRHPSTGEALGADYAVSADRDKVLGWDLTFSAPKSVSVLWATAGASIGMEVREAHDAAVLAGLSYLELHAAFARQGKAGVRQVDTAGLVGAAFVHRSSRAGDPQLHTHVLVSGRVRCTDGVWRALDSRALHRELKPAGMVYQAALRAELTARLGIDWGPISRHGQADIAGVPRTAMSTFSKRARQVEARARELIAAAEAELGRELTDAGRRRIYKVAVLETRPAKAHDGGPVEGLFDRWRTEASAAGHDPDQWLASVLEPPSRPPSPSIPAVVDDVLSQLQHRRSTWTRRDVVRATARRVPFDAGEAAAAHHWVESVTDEVLDHASVIALVAPQPPPPPALCRKDGHSVYDHHGAARYTTVSTLATEQQVLDIVAAGRGNGRGIASAREVDVAITEAEIGEDQAAAVRAVTLDGDTVACVVGPAGAGKSRMLGAATAAWAASGISVRGLAVSAAAAGVLSAETGLPADTVAKLLHEHDRPGRPQPEYDLRPGEVLVVDEASMVPSADLARLVLLVDRAEGKVVLVGDWAQLGAVDAGGLFRLLANDAASSLGTVRRFHANWEADASLRLRDRDPTVLAVYAAHGRLAGGDRTSVLDDAYRRWLEARQAGRSVLVAAADHETVDALAERCRAARIAAGEVEPLGVAAGKQTVGIGDEIITCRNDRRLVTAGGGWVRNGDRWRVRDRHTDGSLTIDDAAGRGQLRLPADYVAEHTALAYAVTVHKAQGITVDDAIVLVDDTTTAESLYVGMTRGRASNTALAVTHDLGDDHPDHGHVEPIDVLLTALGREAAEHAAIAVLRRSLADSESLAMLKPRLANLDAEIARRCPPDRTGEFVLLDARRQHLLEHRRPGVLTRSARAAQRDLEALDRQRARLHTEHVSRSVWLTANEDVIAYRDELADAVDRRVRALGAEAAHEQPAHLLRLLGPLPSEPADTASWIARAGRIEGYREEWGVEADALLQSPRDSVQFRAWEDLHIRTLDALARLDDDLDRGRDRGIGLEL